MIEVHLSTCSHGEWVLNADIEACPDDIDLTSPFGWVHRRIGDGRVVVLRLLRRWSPPSVLLGPSIDWGLDGPIRGLLRLVDVVKSDHRETTVPSCSDHPVNVVLSPTWMMVMSSLASAPVAHSFQYSSASEPEVGSMVS